MGRHRGCGVGEAGWGRVYPTGDGTVGPFQSALRPVAGALDLRPLQSACSNVDKSGAALLPIRPECLNASLSLVRAGRCRPRRPASPAAGRKSGGSDRGAHSGAARLPATGPFFGAGGPGGGRRVQGAGAAARRGGGWQRTVAHCRGVCFPPHRGLHPQGRLGASPGRSPGSGRGPPAGVPPSVPSPPSPPAAPHPFKGISQ